MAIQDKFNRANVIYKITKDIDLGGETLTIPEGCTLDFQGGSFSNGTIVGNITAIQAGLNKIFGLDIELTGTWNVSESYPEWFGAKTGEDDYESVQKTINIFINVCLTNIYNIAKPIVIGRNIHLYGKGTLVKTTDDTFEGINAVLVLSFRCTIENLNLYSNTNNSIGIALYKDTFLSEFKNIRITKCFAGIKSMDASFMTRLEKIHCVHCNNGFDFSNANDKTSLSFVNCWCENCGNAYDLYNATYSSLINCAADYCNYTEDNPYDMGYGDKSTSKGIYNFSRCHNVSIINCGSENSYGNGVVHIDDCDITIDGLTAYSIRSEYKPPYHIYPNYAVGVICSNDSRNTITANNIRIEYFENTYVTENYPIKIQCIVALNYSVQTYGNPNKTLVELGHYLNNSSNLLVFGGHGYSTDKSLCYSKDEERYKFLNLTINDYTDKILNSETSTNKLKIPFKSQGNANTIGMIEIYGIDNSYNNNQVRAFRTLIGFNSLTSVTNATVIEKTSESIAVASSELNLIITLPHAYTNLLISYRIIKTRYIDESNISLTT